MTKYVVVIPYTDAAYFKECLDTLMIPRENILGIDNSTTNLGVASSWNAGIGFMKEKNADWLVVMSAAMRFGFKGGFDMAKYLDERDDYIIHFAQQNFPEQQFVRGITPGIEAGNFSWHCTAISRDCIENVGKFDANFHPIYFEDIDYDLRVQKFYKGRKGHTVIPIDARSDGVGHGVRLGKIKADSTPLIAYYATKWGKHPSAAEINSYDLPFNDKNNSLAFWPPAHGGLWNE